jgi:hypothetical protein
MDVKINLEILRLEEFNQDRYQEYILSVEMFHSVTKSFEIITPECFFLVYTNEQQDKESGVMGDGYFTYRIHDVHVV